MRDRDWILHLHDLPVAGNHIEHFYLYLQLTVSWHPTYPADWTVHHNAHIRLFWDRFWKIELHGTIEIQCFFGDSVFFWWLYSADALWRFLEWCRLVVKSFPLKQSVLDGSVEESSVPGDSMNGTCHFSKTGPSPFSSRKVMYEDEEVRLTTGCSSCD